MFCNGTVTNDTTCNGNYVIVKLNSQKRYMDPQYSSGTQPSPSKAKETFTIKDIDTGDSTTYTHKWSGDSWTWDPESSVADPQHWMVGF